MSTKQKPVRASRSFEAKLARYSALAGAAAATAPAADAAIVHVTGMPVTVGQNGFAGWNIDGAGTSEMYFSQFFLQTPTGFTTYICTETEGSGCSNGYFTYITEGSITLSNQLSFAGNQASFLTEGSANNVVDFTDGFNPAGLVTFFSNAQSPFIPGEQIMGFQFAGKAGWARLTVGPQSLEISEWAYQDEAGVPIVKGQIPEPSSLALLAAGAAGLGLYRRRRQVNAETE